MTIFCSLVSLRTRVSFAKVLLYYLSVGKVIHFFLFIKIALFYVKRKHIVVVSQGIGGDGSSNILVKLD